MATRENVGLQAALIVFVLFTVALSVSTWMYYQKSVESASAVKAAEARVAASDVLTRNATYKYKELLVMIGDPNVNDQEIVGLKAGASPESQAEIAKIRADFDADMKLMEASVDPKERNWRALPKFLLTTINQRGKDLEVAVTAQKKMTDDLKKLRDSEAKKVASTVQELADAGKKHNEGTTVFAGTLAKTAAEKAAIQQAQEAAQKIAAEQAALVIANKTAADTLEKKLRGELRTSTSKLATLNKDTFERPHGQVTWINMRNKTCYINLGRADGLPRQVTFSVYDPNVVTLEVPSAVGERKPDASKDKDEKKAKGRIEVLDLVDDHLAECRILDFDPKNPILPGDQIFTPAWRPGQKMQFALMGKLNLDGGRGDERSKVRSLIEANGGEVVAEVLENGEQIGKITVDTRFLVVGERPSDGADPKLLVAYDKLAAAAEQVGVQQISIRDLTTMMGYKPNDRTTKIGATGTINANPAKKPAAGAAGSDDPDSPAFRPRNPNANPPAKAPVKPKPMTPDGDDPFGMAK